MNYFRFFPQATYQLSSDGITFETPLTQISARAKIMARLQQNISVIYDYIIEGDERPDTVAERVYGGVQYTWLVLLLNNITSLFDSPLSAIEFNDYIITKYGTPAAAQALPVYHMADGTVVDATTYAALLTADQGSVTSEYDEELLLNEAKRRIKIVPAAFVPGLQKELSRLFT